jgi:hypothetical protein
MLRFDQRGKQWQTEEDYDSGHWKENIERHYRFVQVRGRYYRERETLIEMARAMLEFVLSCQ